MRYRCKRAPARRARGGQRGVILPERSTRPMQRTSVPWQWGQVSGGGAGAWGWSGGKAQRGGGQSRSGLGHALVAAMVAEQAVVADFGEAAGEQMEAQTADELDPGQGQGFEAAAVGVILVSEGEGAGVGIECAQAAIGDGHAVGVASQVVQDGVGSDDGALGKDHPAASAHLAQQGREGAGVLEGFTLSVELEFARGVELEQAGAELGPEHMAHRVDREEPAGLFGTGPGGLGGEAAAGDQAVEVGMVHEVLAPGVEDGREADLGLEALRSVAGRTGGAWRWRSQRAGDRAGLGSGGGAGARRRGG